MSVDQLPKPSAAPRGKAQFVQYDEYIDQQVESTRRVVKLVELSTAFVLLVGGVLLFLLAAAVLDHWVIPGGFSALERAVLFAVLVAGVTLFLTRRLWPIVVHKVNPVYAAHAIERTGPTLKNSLVNLLLFRQKRSDISDAVYHTLEEQAAQRLSRVPLDEAVDRSLLIRFGYLLLAIVAIVAAYKVLSPKDPIIAARRVLMPWAEIVPASRVSIFNVRPGRATVSRGESLDISAEVRGIDDDDTVLLLFTTADGRAVEKPIPMRFSADRFAFEATLPNESNAFGKAGLLQDFTYRIEAGDARTLDYPVKVVEAPSILVSKIEYDYPDYTGYRDRAVDTLGDVRAIEGTRVTLHARANGPIREAHVDFDADGRRDVAMKVDEIEAIASFVLALRDDRFTPKNGSYALRFTNADGRENQNPVKHSIDVQPDYSPEAAIVLPKEKTLDVKMDDEVQIVVDASDPDFALADVRLRGEVAGRAVVDEPLLQQLHTGRFSARYTFKPAAHELKAGDVLQYWVAAQDNRTPTANVVESPKQTFRIVAPDPAEQDPANREAERNQQGRGAGEKSADQESGQQGQQGESSKGQDQANGNPRDGEPQRNGQQNGEQQNAEQQDGNEQNGQAESGGDPAGGESAGAGQTGEGKQTQGGGESQQSDDDASGGAPSEPQPSQDSSNTNGGENGRVGKGESGSRNSADQQNQTGDPSPSEQAQQQDGQSSAGAPNESGDSAEGAPNGGVNGARQQGENGQPSGNEQSSPVSAEGDNDGEAFERIQDHLKRTGELKEGESGSSESDPSGSEPTKREGDQQSGAGEAGQSTEQRPDSQQGEQSAQQGKQGEDQSEGAGADTREGESASDQKPGVEQQGEKQSPGGEQTASKGEAGAGDESESQGAPNSQPEMKPTDKTQQSPSQPQENDSQEAPAGSRGKSESDSQGEEGGDRSGGGEEGGGQKAPRDGTGSAGQNQSAEEGAGQSGEKGAGENSSDPGQGAKADGETGQSSGETKGRGSKTREAAGNSDEPAEQGEKSGTPERQEPMRREAARSEEGAWEKQQNDADKRGAKSQEKGERGNQERSQQQDSGRQGAGQSEGGGKAGAIAEPSDATPLAAGDDEANLEYARKQTDMVLGKLEDQLNREKVDPELLKQLGWSQDDLKKFVERWQERKAAAETSDPSADAAKRELDDALRSLGLRPGRLKQSQVRDDQLRDIREGYRGPVPNEYRERLRAYNQGVSRTQQSAE